MTVYLVAKRIRTKDQAELDRYAQVARAAAANAIHHVVYGGQEILEGPPHEGIVILEFPDVAAAKAWYYSDAYQTAREYRLRGADYEITLVQSFSPEEGPGAPLR